MRSPAHVTTAAAAMVIASASRIAALALAAQRFSGVPMCVGYLSSVLALSTARSGKKLAHKSTRSEKL